MAVPSTGICEGCCADGETRCYFQPSVVANVQCSEVIYRPFNDAAKVKAVQWKLKG